jgi:putative ABC transport system permease protein
MSVFLRHLLYALKINRRRYRSALVVVMLFALGVGATTTMFTVLYDVVLRPLPFRNPERLVLVGGAPSPPTGSTLGWCGQASAFQSLCLFSTGGVNLSEGDRPERISAAAVSPSFFSVFDVSVVIGRRFVTDEESPGRNHVAILSSRLWATFGRDPQIIGRSISLNGTGYSVIGVAEPGFEFPGHADLWMPLVEDWRSSELGQGDQADLPSFLNQNVMVGRLKEGASAEESQSELRALQTRLQDSYSKSGLHFGAPVSVLPLREALVKEYRPALLMLFAAVGFLLVIGCANAASLLLARAASRQKEMAILLSVGASRKALVGQLLAESVVLSGLGGIVGVLLTYLCVGTVRLWGPARIPRISGLQVDVTVLIFAACASLAVGIVVGLVPALSLVRSEFGETLKGQGTTGPSGLGRRARNSMVVLEVALALTLVVGAGLSDRSFFSLARVAPGFEPENLLTVKVSLPKGRYAESVAPANDSKQPAPGFKPDSVPPMEGSPPKGEHTETAASGNDSKKLAPGESYKAAEFYKAVINQIKGLPGVTGAAGVSQIPLGGTSGGQQWVDTGNGQGGEAFCFHIQGDYFGAMGIPIMSGRSFADTDSRRSQGVVVISNSFGRLWNGKNPIGDTVKVGSETAPRQIVGIVGDVKYTGLGTGSRPQIYLPCTQPLQGRQAPLDMVLVIRTASDPKALVGPAADAVASIDKGLPVFHIRTMEEVISESLSDYRFRGELLGLFAVLSALITIAGVYGVVSYSVKSRTREIGIRMAVGASRKDVLLMVLREASLLSMAGACIGAIGAVALGRVVSSFLFGVLPTDPATIVAAVFFLVLAAMAASLVPAVAASRIEPASVLRYE